jgi:hypothetical protein
VACTEPLDCWPDPLPDDAELDEPVPEEDEPDELVPDDPVPDEPVPEDAEPDELVPDEPEPLLADEPLLDVLPPDDVLWCVDPGSVAAMAPVASTLATPTPAVTADSRFMPRCRSAAGGTGRPAGLLGIAHPLLPPCGRIMCVLQELCRHERRATSRQVLNYL